MSVQLLGQRSNTVSLSPLKYSVMLFTRDGRFEHNKRLVKEVTQYMKLPLPPRQRSPEAKRKHLGDKEEVQASDLDYQLISEASCDWA